MRHELARALEVIAAEIDLVVRLFADGDDGGADPLLAALYEELRLACVLDNKSRLSTAPSTRKRMDTVAPLAPELLIARERQALSTS